MKTLNKETTKLQTKTSLKGSEWLRVGLKISEWGSIH